MDSLKDVVRQAVAGYARSGINVDSYLTQSENGLILGVVDVIRAPGKHLSDVSMIVRIVGLTIIIERDQNDKPLVDALVQAGVPRRQIVLAYAGEPVPDAV